MSISGTIGSVGVGQRLVAVVGLVSLLSVSSGCGTSNGSTSGDSDAASAGGGIGTTCTPAAESIQTFLGFDFREVSTESNFPQCQSRLCLVNHFQGGTTPGSATPGSAAPGSATTGGTAAGGTTPGSATTGGTTPGSATTGGMATGGTAPGTGDANGSGSAAATPGGAGSGSGRASTVVDTVTEIGVASVPSGARIYVDGVDTGKITPAKLDVPRKSHGSIAITLKLKGYEAFTFRSVEVGESSQQKAELVKIKTEGSSAPRCRTPERAGCHRDSKGCCLEGTGNRNGSGAKTGSAAEDPDGLLRP